MKSQSESSRTQVIILPVVGFTDLMEVETELPVSLLPTYRPAGTTNAQFEILSKLKHVQSVIN